MLLSFKTLGLILLQFGMCTIASGQKNNPDSLAPKKNIIKIAPLSPLLNKIEVGYERAIRPNMSLDFRGGIVHRFYRVYEDDLYQEDYPENGFMIAGGPMWKFKPDMVEGEKGKFLRGMYGKAELGYLNFQMIHVDFRSIYDPFRRHEIYTEKHRYWAYNVSLIIGKQFTFNNFILDTYLGTGFGRAQYSFKDDYGNTVIRDVYGPFYGFTHIYGGLAFPTTYTAGFRLGWKF